MSLIVDALKIAQRDGISKRPIPQFIKYPYEEGLCLRALISKYIWLFGAAIGFIIVVILTVFIMTSLGENPAPEPDVSHKTIAAPQRFSVASAKNESSEDMIPPGQQEAPPIEPEEEITVRSPEGKKTKSEDQNTSAKKILLEKRPSHGIKPHFDLAVSCQKRGEKAKAMVEYRKVIQIDPMNVEAHNNLGVIYKDMGKLDQAVKEFQTALAINPQQEKAHNNLGIIFYLQGNPGKAIQEFRGVLDINPSNIEAYVNLGVIYKRRNRIREAKMIFEKALSIDPYYPEAHYNLGLISEEGGNIKEAMSHYQKFIDFSGTTYRELAAKVETRLKILSQSQR